MSTASVAMDRGAPTRPRYGSMSRDRKWALRWSYVFLVLFAIFFLTPPLYMFVTSLKTSSESYERDIDSMQFALDRHIFGSVDDVRRRVDEFIESGVQHFELKIIYPTMDSLYRQMELWAENILPKYN